MTGCVACEEFFWEYNPGEKCPVCGEFLIDAEPFADILQDDETAYPDTLS